MRVKFDLPPETPKKPDRFLFDVRLAKRPREAVNESGLIVIREDLTPEQKHERREDNKAARLSREIHRKRKPHGRQ